jgi:succinoglycan biosynthesis protein ExoH
MAEQATSRLGRWLWQHVGRHVSSVPPAQLSRTIDFARISLIVGLVFLHYGMYPNFRVNPFGGMSVGEYEIATFVNSFLLFFFLSVVPLLSIISGWLFFSFFDEANAEPAASLSSRIRRRFASLYLPLIVWNFIYLTGLLIVYTFSPDYPLFAALNIDFDTANLKQYFNAVFAFNHHPLAFQFWFVRDLFLTVLLSPVLWLLLRRSPLTAAAALCVAWLVNYDLEIFFRPDVPFFFFLGGLVRSKKLDFGLSARATNWLVAAYLVIVAARAMAPYAVEESTLMLGAMTRAMRLVGVLACWGLFLRLSAAPLGARIARWGPLAFFLHAAHFPLMAEVKLLLWDVLPEINDFWMVTHYLVSVLVTLFVCLGTGAVLVRYAPGVFGLLNGGRVPKSLRPSGVLSSTASG